MSNREYVERKTCEVTPFRKEIEPMEHDGILEGVQNNNLADIDPADEALYHGEYEPGSPVNIQYESETEANIDEENSVHSNDENSVHSNENLDNIQRERELHELDQDLNRHEDAEHILRERDEYETMELDRYQNYRDNREEIFDDEIEPMNFQPEVVDLQRGMRNWRQLHRNQEEIENWRNQTNLFEIQNLIQDLIDRETRARPRTRRPRINNNRNRHAHEDIRNQNDIFEMQDLLYDRPDERLRNDTRRRHQIHRRNMPY